jgi:hypothetical protein
MAEVAAHPGVVRQFRVRPHTVQRVALGTSRDGASRPSCTRTTRRPPRTRSTRRLSSTRAGSCIRARTSTHAIAWPMNVHTPT